MEKEAELFLKNMYLKAMESLKAVKISGAKIQRNGAKIGSMRSTSGIPFPPEVDCLFQKL